MIGREFMSTYKDAFIGLTDNAVHSPRPKPATPELRVPGGDRGEYVDAVESLLLQNLATLSLTAQAHMLGAAPVAPEGAARVQSFEMGLSRLGRFMADTATAINKLPKPGEAPNRPPVRPPAGPTEPPAEIEALVSDVNNMIGRRQNAGADADGSGISGLQMMEDLPRATEAEHHEFLRRLFVGYPELWGDGARAELGMPPALPDAIDRAAARFRAEYEPAPDEVLTVDMMFHKADAMRKWLARIGPDHFARPRSAPVASPQPAGPETSKSEVQFAAPDSAPARTPQTRSRPVPGPRVRII
jgi:hypothetical protein